MRERNIQGQRSSPAPRRLMLASLVLAGGCAEPVVELSFRAPANAEQLDTSCITAIEIRAIGTGFVQDDKDYTRSCVELPRAAATYGALHDMFRDKITLELPESGLAGVTMRGYAGPTPCARTDDSDPEFAPHFTADLAFFAKANYIGQDSIAIQAVPNLKCPTTDLKVRVVDMFKLVASGSSAACGAAMTYTDGKGWSSLGTLVPKLYGKGVDFFGGVSWRPGTNNLVTFPGMVQLARPGESSCLALAAANESGATNACVISGAGVCAAVGELETAAVDYRVWQQVDRTLQGQFPNILFGSVWTNASPKTPAGGAVITVDSKHGKVVYVDPFDATGKLVVRSDQTRAGPSGLFVLYADTLVNAKIEAAGATRTVMLGSPDYTFGGAMIVLP
ncbi:MAG TPA: hypothetical protein VIV11_32450 [Kofleriaceae bacterium]